MHAPPLAPGWLTVVDELARARLSRADRTGPALAELVRALSDVYNRRAGTLRDQEASHVARLRFFLPRDLPKIGGPLAELGAAGALPAGPVWRVLDLGAGLGTTGLGVAAFAGGVPGVERLEIHAVERDAGALDLYEALAARCGEGSLAEVAPVRLSTEVADLTRTEPDGRYDLIVVGLALNELYADAPDPVASRAAWLGRLARVLADGGSLVVLEPALRDVTRLLMEVRDRIAGGHVEGLGVFGPCTHDHPCPLLLNPRDWCHEVLDHALPDPLQPVAKAAGLRWERLTYAALVLRADGLRLAPGAQRVVGGPIATKGKVEWMLCGPQGCTRLARLDRHRGPDEPIGDAARGAVLELDAEPGERVRSDRIGVRRIR